MQDWRQEYVEYVTVRIPALRRLAYHLCGDEHTADDLVQEAITKLYVHWKRASDATNLDAYVRAMLVRTFLDDKRRACSGEQSTAFSFRRSSTTNRAYAEPRLRSMAITL